DFLFARVGAADDRRGVHLHFWLFCGVFWLFGHGCRLGGGWIGLEHFFYGFNGDIQQRLAGRAGGFGFFPHRRGGRVSPFGGATGARTLGLGGGFRHFGRGR